MIHSNTKLVNLGEVSASLFLFILYCLLLLSAGSPCRLSATLQGGTENQDYCTSILNLSYSPYLAPPLLSATSLLSLWL